MSFLSGRKRVPRNVVIASEKTVVDKPQVVHGGAKRKPEVGTRSELVV